MKFKNKSEQTREQTKPKRVRRQQDFSKEQHQRGALKERVEYRTNNEFDPCLPKWNQPEKRIQISPCSQKGSEPEHKAYCWSGSKQNRTYDEVMKAWKGSARHTFQIQTNNQTLLQLAAAHPFPFSRGLWWHRSCHDEYQRELRTQKER